MGLYGSQYDHIIHVALMVTRVSLITSFQLPLMYYILEISKNGVWPGVLPVRFMWLVYALTSWKEWSWRRRWHSSPGLVWMWGPCGVEGDLQFWTTGSPRESEIILKWMTLLRLECVLKQSVHILCSRCPAMCVWVCVVSSPDPTLSRGKGSDESSWISWASARFCDNVT